MGDATQTTGADAVGPSRALTLHQPWASLIALGVKTIETRSWSTPYRGPLAIHAGMTPLGSALPGHWVGEYCVGQSTVGESLHMVDCECPDPDDGCWAPQCDALNDWVPALLHDERAHGFTVSCLLPLGAVVATCELIDVAPIGGPLDFRTGCAEGDEGDFPGHPVVVRHPALSSIPEALVLDESGRQRDISCQLPYGNFARGRYAWILGDVRPLPEPIPAKGRQGLWRWEGR